MKRIIAILLITAFSFQLSVKVGIVGYYLININYISEVLCINKNKPELECKGKCHLKMQLDKQEYNEQSLPVSIKETTETILFIEPLALIDAKTTAITAHIQAIPYTFSVVTNLAHSIFHPPQTV